MGTILASGLLNGCFYGLGPIFAAQSGLTPAQVGQFMALSIAAGLLAQLPLGKLSDRFSRITLIRLTAALLGIAYLPLACMEAPEQAWVMVAGIVIGFLQFCLYPLGAVHANASLEPELRVSMAGVLLVTFGIGATIGPLAAGALMEHLGPKALYLFGAGVTVLVVCLVREKESISAALIQTP